MPKHALSKLRKSSIHTKKRDQALLELVGTIKKAQNNAIFRGTKSPSVPKLVDQYNVSATVKIPRTSVYNHLKNPRLPTKAQASSVRRHLNDAEESTLVAVILNQAERGFSLTSTGVV